MEIKEQSNFLDSNDKPDESGETEEKRETKSFYTEMILSGVLNSEFSKCFSDEILNTSKDCRLEALHKFKVEYITRKLRLADVLKQSKHFFGKFENPTTEAFKENVSLGNLTETEQEEILSLAEKHIKNSKKLCDFIYGENYDEDKDLEQEDAVALFYHLTGNDPSEDEIYVGRIGDTLCFWVETKDFETIYALKKTGKDKQRAIKKTKSLEGFAWSDLPLSFSNKENQQEVVTIQLVVINVDKIPFADIKYSRDIYEHEYQHIFHSMLYKQFEAVTEEIKTQESMQNLMSEWYTDDYLEQLRNEVIASVIDGAGMDIEEVTQPGRLYYYPKKSDLGDLRDAIGDKNFRKWKAKQYWTNSIISQYKKYAAEMILIGNKLSVYKGKDREKIIALFEIEPPQKWRRLYKWLQDPKIKKDIGIDL